VTSAEILRQIVYLSSESLPIGGATKNCFISEPLVITAWRILDLKEEKSRGYGGRLHVT